MTRQDRWREPEWPLTWTPPSRAACLGLFLATRDEPGPGARAFLGRERVLEAIDYGALRVGDPIRIAKRVTTAGRYLVSECLPPDLRGEVEAGPCTARRVEEWLARVARTAHVEIAARCAEALAQLGERFAARSGASLAMGDFAAPAGVEAVVAAALDDTGRVLALHREGHITDGERYNTTVDVWCAARAKGQALVREHATAHDPIVAIDSTLPAREALAALPAREALAALPARAALAALAAVSAEADDAGRVLLGHVAHGRWGELFEAPVARSYGEGLTAHEYAMTCRAARAARLLADERDGIAATLLRDLHAALSEVLIASRDCGAREGVAVHRGSDADPRSFAAALEGRVTATEVLAPDGEVLAPVGALITPPLAARIDAALVASVVLRDPVTCAETRGVCARCFGLDPDDATWPAEGDPVGARAASTIAREAREFTARVFHIC